MHHAIPTPDDIYKLLAREENETSVDNDREFPSIEKEDQEENGQVIGWQADIEEVSRDWASSELKKIIGTQFNAESLFYSVDNDDEGGYYETLLLGNIEEGWAIELRLGSPSYCDDNYDSRGSIGFISGNSTKVQNTLEKLIEDQTQQVASEIENQMVKLLMNSEEKDHTQMIQRLWEKMTSGKENSRLFCDVITSTLTHSSLDETTPTPKKARKSPRM